MRWQDPSDRTRFEIDRLRLTEVDAAGKLSALVLFDPGDRAAASAELFERHARSADRLPAVLIEYLRAWNEHDLTSVRALLSEDFFLHDHRRTGIGRVDREGNFAAVAALHELSRDVRLEMLYEVAAAPHGRLMVFRWFGTNAEGGAFEVIPVALLHVEGERLRAVELFEIEDLDAARTRFEELRAGRGSPATR